MAKTNSKTQHVDAELQAGDVPDEVVSHVGKAVAQIMKLRQTYEENAATVQSEEERQNLAEQVETAAVRAIDEEGLTVDRSRPRSSPRHRRILIWKSEC